MRGRISTQEENGSTEFEHDIYTRIVWIFQIAGVSIVIHCLM